MAGKGAPEGNQYAKKEAAGRTIGLYMTGEELGILTFLLVEQNKEVTQKAIDMLARSIFKDAVREKERS